MKTKRYLLAGVILFIFAIAWNAGIHLFVLAEVDASVRHLRRADFGDKLALSFLLTGGIIAIFLAGWIRFFRTGSFREGAYYGFLFGVLAGLLVDLNQYIVYPIPGSVAALWCCSGIMEFTIYGVLASRVLRPITAGRVDAVGSN